MKFRVLLLLTLLAVAFTALQCHKKPTEPEDGIFGLWAWERSVGGYAGETIYADSVDYFRWLDISENFYYTAFRDDSVLVSSAFSLDQQEEPNGDTVMVIRILDYPPNLPSYIVRYVGRDSLILEDTCDDCYTSKYTRLDRGI